MAIGRHAHAVAIQQIKQYAATRPINTQAMIRDALSLKKRKNWIKMEIFADARAAL